jgi:hypothetical protein
MERTESSETWAHKIQTPGNRPKERTRQANSRFSQFRERGKKVFNVCFIE